jgi:hypothetical protein
MFAYADTDSVSNKRTITQSQWSTLTDDKAFSYKDEKEQKEKVQENSGSFFNALFAFFSRSFGKVLIWLLVIILLVFGIYKIFISDRFYLFEKEKRSSAGSPVENIEDITDVNWEDRLQQALKANDFRLAVRYSYMWFLQLLQQQQLIQYRTDKTNYDYYSELADSAYKQPFRVLTREYEYAWYGHYDLSEAAFNDYMQTFNSLKHKLTPA